MTRGSEIIHILMVSFKSRIATLGRRDGSGDSPSNGNHRERSPGRQGLSDFTEVAGLGVHTSLLAGTPLEARLDHVRLAFSGWEPARIVPGRESFVAPGPGLAERS